MSNAICDWFEVFDEIENMKGDPDKYRDEECEPPTAESCDRAIDAAAFLSEGEYNFPYVRPNGKGGIVLEHRSTPWSAKYPGVLEEIEIDADGVAAVYTRFENSKVVCRDPWS